MPPSTIDAQIRARIAEFAEELSSLVRQAAVETVQDALGGAAAPARRRGPGRPRKAKAARRKPGRRPGRPRSTKATKATARAGKRVRRSAEDIEALAGKVLAYVRANAGDRLEQVSAGLRIASKELKRPVATLLEAGKLRTEGQKRGTRYFAGGRESKTARKRARKARRSKATRRVAKKARRTKATRARARRKVARKPRRRTPARRSAKKTRAAPSRPKVRRKSLKRKPSRRAKPAKLRERRVVPEAKPVAVPQVVPTGPEPQTA